MKEIEKEREREKEPKIDRSECERINEQIHKNNNNNRANNIVLSLSPSRLSSTLSSTQFAERDIPLFSHIHTASGMINSNSIMLDNLLMKLFYIIARPSLGSPS